MSSLDGDTSSRAAALGRMTTAYTIGATIGPALGGYLGETDLYAGARLAVWGSVVSIVLSVVYLKDHKRRDKDDSSSCCKSAMQQSNRQSSAFMQSMKRSASYLHHPIIGPLLFIKLLNGISSSAFSTILPLIMTNELNFGTAELGYYMSANSLSVALFACVGIGPSMNLLGDRADGLAFWGIGCRAGAFVAFGLIVTQVVSIMGDDSEIVVSNQAMLVTTLASIVVSLTSHAHATSLTTLTTGSVSSEERGAILGLEHGLFSMARIVGPPLGTTLLSRGPVLFGLDGIGADGLWRVVFICVMIDLALLALLRTWSIRQDGRTVEVELKHQTESFVKGDDHDHSD